MLRLWRQARELDRRRQLRLHVVPLTARFSRVRMKTPTVRGVLDLDDPGEPTGEESPR